MSEFSRWISSAATRCGPHHPVNQDCFGADDRAGLFVVADGVGGSTDGEIASAAVVGILHEVVAPEQDLEARVRSVEQALLSVNTALWRAGQDRPEPTTVATTVVALILADGHAVCLWAGDSRVYLYRDHLFYQLTRDHNVAVEFGTEGETGGQLTRAVGSAEQIDVERLITPTEPGDLFILCSDGVTKVLDDAELASFLDGAVEGSAPRVIGAVVERGGPDDATAIVVGNDGEL